MASPQLENGYTSIANEIMEALPRIRIPPEARRVLDVIIRKTYGFRKKKDRISLSQFAMATGIPTSKICRALKRLSGMNMITIEGEYNGNIYSINKDYTTWNDGWVLPRVGTPKTPQKVLPQPASRVLPRVGDTKEIYTKENNKNNKHMLERKKGPAKSKTNLSSKTYNDVYKIVDAFEPVNAHWESLHENKKQYDASMRMLNIHGLPYILKVIKELPETNDRQFFPKIYTPVQLEEKWEAWHSAVNKGKTKII